MGRNAATASSARMCCSGASREITPTGIGSGISSPTSSWLPIGSCDAGTTCATVPLRTITNPCDSSSDSRMLPSSAERTGVAVVSVTRLSGVSVVTMVRPSIWPIATITSSSRAFEKRSELAGPAAADCARSGMLQQSASTSIARVSGDRIMGQNLVWTT